MKNFESLNQELLNAGVELHTFMHEKMSAVSTLVNTKTSSKTYKDIPD